MAKMKNRIIKLAFSSLAALLLAGCSGMPIPETGNLAEQEASHPIHNQPLIVESGIMPNSPQTAALTDTEEDYNVPAQVSCETQPSSKISEVPLPQDETPQETADPSNPAIDEPAPTNEEASQIAVAPEVGYRAPEFAMMGADGNYLRLCDFDRPVLLNFWNSGCKPCRDEMRYLQKVYDERRDEGLLVLAVNIGQSPTSIQSFMEDNNLHIPVLFDVNAAIARQYQVQFLPTSFFIDTDCIIREKVIGSFPSEAAIEKKLSSIMPE
jgi:peroxiredoxin